MKIFKPDNLALLYRNMRIAGRDRLTLGLMAFFPFDKPGKDALLPEAQMWAEATAAVGADAVLDEGSPKSRGEFLVYGSAHAPAGTMVGELAVSVALGPLKKSLLVHGDRHFNALGFISAPEPFSVMPIIAQTTFGGEDFAENSAGKGSTKIILKDGSMVLPLPNVESASHPVASAGDRVPPSGFWALPAQATERTRQLGSFDKRWLANTWPHLPETTNPEYFQVAPPDQRLDGFFRGDEKISIIGMHPLRARLDAVLPGLRARCFVNRRVLDGEEFSEVETRAETVWLFPDLGCGIVLYRALINTAQEDGEDILHVMADWELMADAPLQFAHYHREFLQQVPKPVQGDGGAIHGSVPAVAPPAPPGMALAATTPVAGAVAVPDAGALAGGETLAQSPELQEVHRLAAELNKNTQEVMQQHGITEADLAPFLKEEPELPPRSLEEIHKLAADLQANNREMMTQLKLTDKDLEPFQPKPEIESGDPVGALAKAMAELNADTQATMSRLGITPADVAAQIAKNPDLAAISGAAVPDVAAVMAGLAAVMPAVSLPKPEVPNVALPVPVADAPATQSKLTREDVIARHAAKKTFASHDLSGLDLSGLDLSGADFSGALLEKTSFMDSRLASSVFKDALLSGGEFSGADLSGAMLVGVSAGSAIFAKTRMEGVNASKGDFTGADFSAAQLGNSNISGAIFDGSKMAGIKAGNCNAQQASFADCDLGVADFTDARLTAAVFTSAKLGKANFTNTACDNAEFYGADATQANFTNANLKASRADATSQFSEAQLGRSHLGRAAWEGVQLAKANLEGAVLDDADFSRAQAADARFGRASAKGARFDKADISRADFTGVNLFKGSMRHTKTEATLLRKANLYGVDFYGTSPTIASLEGSNIDQTLLVIRKPVV